MAAAMVGALLVMTGCDYYHLNLHDCYFVTRNADYGEGYFLECNPGYPLRDDVPQIDNVASVAWNSRLIVVEQMPGGTEETAASTTPDAPNVWWIIPAAGEELMCGNDTILGPMSDAEKDAWLAANPPTERLKHRRY